MDQIKKGKPIPGIDVSGKGEFIRFAGKIIKIASDIVSGLDESFVQKTYDIISFDSNCVALRWSMYCETEALEIDSLKYYKQFLQDCSDTDLQMLCEKTPFIIESKTESMDASEKINVVIEVCIVLEQKQDTEILTFIEDLNKAGFQQINKG